jgi:hypothetical protein
MIIKVQADNEKARSIYRMTKDREEFIKTLEINDNSATVITENYYEIIKELGTILLLLKGLKATGEYAHKEIIEHLEQSKFIDSFEASISQDLRIKRNYSSYEGKRISKEYLAGKKKSLLDIIKKLRSAVEKELK